MCIRDRNKGQRQDTWIFKRRWWLSRQTIFLQWADQPCQSAHPPLSHLQGKKRSTTSTNNLSIPSSYHWRRERRSLIRRQNARPDWHRVPNVTPSREKPETAFFCWTALWGCLGRALLLWRKQHRNGAYSESEKKSGTGSESSNYRQNGLGKGVSMWLRNFKTVKYARSLQLSYYSPEHSAISFFRSYGENAMRPSVIWTTNSAFTRS